MRKQEFITILKFSIIYLSAAIKLCSTTTTTDNQLPERVERCKYGDTDCIKNVLTYAFHRMTKGDHDIGLVRLDPIRIKNIHIEHGDVDLNLQSVKISGMKGLEVLEVKGFGKDPTKRHEMRFKKNLIYLTGNYKINARYESIPIIGEGKTNISLAHVEMYIAFNGKRIQTENGEESIKPEKLSFRIKQRGGSLNFESLFDGDQKQTDSINNLLNKNFDNIFMSLRDPISKNLGRLATKILQKLFSKLPYNKLFIEE